jgi:2',3'-cyclic-nucleotide 2'-phosphodiesterase (5'-nucleotidase family)
VQGFKPYVIQEVRGKRLGAKPLRVGILGVVEKPATAGSPTGGYTVTDPVEAAKKLVPELRKKVDLVVVLAYVDRDTAKRIGLEAPGIDLVLAAHQFPLYNAVDEAGDAVVAMVSSQTKWLGEIRLYASKDPKGPAISNYLHRDVPLDQVIPDDPTALKVVQSARAAFQKTPPITPVGGSTH